MDRLFLRNQKIIDAVIEKANKKCPGSLAIIGIYGSFETGDFYEKSDLDLLVLINDDKGWQLGCTFIQDDLEVGHDIYCTTWDNLQEYSLYNNPNISMLMDSKIVYCADKKYSARLESLRKAAKDILSADFSREDYCKAEKMIKEAEHFYMQAVIAEELSDIRVNAGYAVYYVENAVAMLNKKYFRYGTKQVYEELEQMENKPDKLCEMIESVISGRSAEQIKEALTVLICETVRVFKKTENNILTQKKPASADSLRGTYEEMFSNWRNKMYAAADGNNRHLAFMSMISLSAMISDLHGEMNIADYNIFDGYDPQDLRKTAQAFDKLAEAYLNEYMAVGLQAERYKDIDEFAACYLGE